MASPVKARRVIVHDLAHARAAVGAAADVGAPVTLMSAPGAAGYLGAQVFRHMIIRARRERPGVQATSVLDCGDDVGLALGAIRQRVEGVRVRASRPVRRRLAEIAVRAGVHLDAERGTALDLLDAADPAAACRAWLGRGKRPPRAHTS
jgi:fructose/tagatose bisphosphate aldolase